MNGLRPSYISVDRKNRFLICGGYHDGKLTALRLNEDGSVGEVTDEIFMKGLGSSGGFHYRSHVNCAVFSPDERYVMAVDLGMDQVKIYEFDHESGKFHLHDILRSELESGPKHMVFSSDGKYAYLTHEYSNTVIKYSYEAKNAQFTQMQSESTLDGYEGTNSTITLKLTDDDHHLFATNSGDNSFAIFNIDEKDQSMKRICVLPVSGEYPRDLAILPGGRRVISVNQEGNSLTSFIVDYEKGYMLMKNKHKVYVMYDSDEAGVKASIRAIPMLQSMGFLVRRIETGEYKDPDELLKEKGKEGFLKRFEESIDGTEYMLEHLNGEKAVDYLRSLIL